MRIVTLASGSTGNCTLFSDGETHILVDAGISMKRISLGLSRLGLELSDVAAVFITHEHKDHTTGLGTMVKRTQIPIFAPAAVGEHLQKTVPGVAEKLGRLGAGESVALGIVEVSAFASSHDTQESVGYRISGSTEAGLLTDTGRFTDDMFYALEGVNTLVLEANHDVEMLRRGPYPYFLKRRVLSHQGHLSNDDCALAAEALCRAGVEGLILAHLSRENNSPELALSTVGEHLSSKGLRPMLYAAPVDGACVLEGRPGSCLESKLFAAESSRKSIT